MPVKFQNQTQSSRTNSSSSSAAPAVADPNSDPDPDRKHFKCLRFHSQLKCECSSRLRKAGRAKTLPPSAHAAIYSISAASLHCGNFMSSNMYSLFLRLYSYLISNCDTSRLNDKLRNFRNISIVI